MTDDQLAMVDTLEDMALETAGGARDAAMMLVSAAGADELLRFAQGYRAVVIANDELRREQRTSR